MTKIAVRNGPEDPMPLDDYNEEDNTTVEKGPWTVAIYMIDRQYGGPEEGGWYYDAGDPDIEFIKYLRGFDDEEEANAYCFDLNARVCEELNKGRPSIGSVLSQGRYAARVCDGFPKHFPKHRPYYE